MNTPEREGVLARFDALPAIERELATVRFERYREDLKRIGYDAASYDADPMVFAAELATVAVALDGSWEDVFQAITDQLPPEQEDSFSTIGAAQSLALLWMGESQDVPT
jgi:hypothetical protein